MATLEISPQIKTRPPGIGSPPWVGEWGQSWAVSLEQSNRQGAFVGSAFQTVKCISNLQFWLLFFRYFQFEEQYCNHNPGSHLLDNLPWMRHCCPRLFTASLALSSRWPYKVRTMFRPILKTRMIVKGHSSSQVGFTLRSVGSQDYVFNDEDTLKGWT